MSVCRALPAVTSSCAFSKFAASTPAARACLRTFSSSVYKYASAKRELQTASAYRPHALPDSFPPPSRNSGVPDTSIAGGLPDYTGGRTPSHFERSNATVTLESDQKSSISLSEAEAQKSKVIASPSPLSAKPRKSRLRARKAAMTITPAALTHLKNLTAQPDPKMIRVGVKNRGCSGLAYHLEYVEKAGAFDEVVEQEGVKVLIDSKALFSIIGSEMDWQEDKLSTRFVFRNPNISESIVSFMPNYSYSFSRRGAVRMWRVFYGIMTTGTKREIGYTGTYLIRRIVAFPGVRRWILGIESCHYRKCASIGFNFLPTFLFTSRYDSSNSDHRQYF